MVCKHLEKFICSGAKYVGVKRNEALHLDAMLYHSSKESHEELLPLDWYEKLFPKITKLASLLKDVDLIDGRLVDIRDGSVVIDDRIERKMHTFKSLARVFIGSPSVQKTLEANMAALPAGKGGKTFVCFSKPSEREPMLVNSLSKVSNFLNITAQQRKVIRYTICPQVTHHRIWTGTIEEVLNGLKLELDYFNLQSPSKGTQMGQQIVSNCLKFMQDNAISCDLESTSWMRLVSAKGVQFSDSHKWEDVLEMFNDLIECLKIEDWLLHHVTKLEAMKEGLSQIKDVLIDKSIGYKEARLQESLVQKKLTKVLGYPSKCLFTLLLYYLCGHVRDIEVDLSGGFYNNGNDFCLSMGKIVTSDEEKMIWSGVRHLDRALGLFKFVWETAGTKGVLDLQGHLWCVGFEDRMLTYKGKKFFIHGINI
ncbi:exosome complex exonuclease [Parasponia andersonii]|uniref:Exosome complex exonuclease n=1 Tax=Parasponia andersonii TaxID=3476 RepID=A0A2P5CA51_PARAD|nr:exosome complex exonuclease [Parasponia andersonii]